MNALAYSPDGRLIATAHQERLVKLYDSAKGSRVRYFGRISDAQRAADAMQGGTPPAALALSFSHSGDRLLVGSADGRLALFRVADGTLLSTLRSDWGEVTGVAFTSDDKAAVAGDGRGHVSILPVAGAAGGQTIQPHSRPVSAVFASGSGRSFAFSASEDGTVAIIDTATRGVLAHLIRGVDARWLVVTPSGLFDGTETAASTLVAWRHGLHTHTPGDLPAGFKVPGLLVGRVLSDPPERAGSKRTRPTSQRPERS